MADNKPINREIPCLNYLSFLPEWDEKLSMCIKILKKNGYSPDMIIGYFLQSDVSSLFEGHIDYDTIKRLFPGSPGSCANNAKRYFNGYGFNKKLCEGCIFSTKCKNAKIVEEGEVLGYLLDHADIEGLIACVSDDLFNGIATYYEHSQDVLEFRNIPFMKVFFDGIKAMLEVADIPSFRTREDSYYATIKMIQDEEIAGIAPKEIGNFSDELRKYILQAKVLQDRDFHDKIAYLRTGNASSDHSEINKEPTCDVSLDKDGVEASSSDSSLSIDDLALELDETTCSDEEDITETSDYWDTEEDLNQDDSLSSIEENPIEMRLWANPIAKQLEDANRNASIGKSLFDYNGALILSRKDVFNLCITIHYEDACESLFESETYRNVAVEMAKVDGKGGLIVCFSDTTLLYFIPENCLTKPVLKSLFSGANYVHTTNQALISGCLYMQDLPFGADIRSLSAVYAALNGVKNKVTAAHIFTFCKEYYSDRAAYYLQKCMPKYADIFWDMYEKVLNSHQDSLYIIHDDYEIMLGSSLTLSRFFECDSENLHRISYQDSSFSYSPSLKKRDQGTVIMYTFKEKVETKTMDMTLMEDLLHRVRKYSSKCKIVLILLSVKVGELVMFCPFEKPQDINFIHQTMKYLIEDSFYDMGFRPPLVKKSDDRFANK